MKYSIQTYIPVLDFDKLRTSFSKLNFREDSCRDIKRRIAYSKLAQGFQKQIYELLLSLVPAIDHETINFLKIIVDEQFSSSTGTHQGTLMSRLISKMIPEDGEFKSLSFLHVKKWIQLHDWTEQKVLTCNKHWKDVVFLKVEFLPKKECEFSLKLL